MDVAVKCMPSSQRHFGVGASADCQATQGTRLWQIRPDCGKSEYSDHQHVEEFFTKVKDYTKQLPKLVEKYRGCKIPLKQPKDYAVRITDLDGTVYWGRDEMLESWSELYLPEPTTMVVIGAIDNVPSLAPGLQLIVLVDSKGQVYFYENEVLHLIAPKLQDFFKKGAASPIKSFEYGQCLN